MVSACTAALTITLASIITLHSILHSSGILSICKTVFVFFFYKKPLRLLRNVIHTDFLFLPILCTSCFNIVFLVFLIVSLVLILLLFFKVHFDVWLAEPFLLRLMTHLSLHLCDFYLCQISYLTVLLFSCFLCF